MSNLFWYNFLAAVGLVIAATTVYKRRKITPISTLIMFYIFATSLTWLGEFIVLGFFDSYAYKPGIFTDPWAENLAAHLILNSFLWPGVALLVAAYSLSYGGMLLISFAFVAVETLFMKFGLYEQHWWKSYMTAGSVFIYLVLAKIWFVKMVQTRGRSSRAVIFYFISVVVIHTPTPLLLLFGKQYYKMALVESMVRSSIIFSLSYQLIECLVLTFFVCVLSKWYWKLVPFAVAIIGQSILAYMGVLIFLDDWNLHYSLLLYTIAVAACILIEKYFLMTPEKPNLLSAVRRYKR